MPNDNEHPRYTDPEHPYSGSGRRYQNNYNRDEYHAGDGPFQFPWWAIIIGFVVWYPLGFIFIGLNNAMKKGKLGGLEQKAHDRVQSFNKVSTTPVYAAQSRPVYEQGAQTPNAASAKPQMQGKKGKNAWLATGLTVAGACCCWARWPRCRRVSTGCPKRWPRATITGAGCCPT